MRPFEFLADASGITDGTTLAQTARRAEDAGYTGLVAPDHLLQQLSPVVVMSTVVAVTERLRVQGYVLNNDLRHPAVLAHDLASIDVLSGGRLDVAIGAGWNKPEYDAIGLPFDPTPVRQARLAEAVSVLKSAFAGQPFSLDGEHYSITDYTPGITSAQRPHPPFFIGGGGRRTLTLAGREADVVGLCPRITRDVRLDGYSMTLAATREKIEWVREAAGDRFDRLRFNLYPSGWPAVVTDDLQGEATKASEALSARATTPLSVDDVLDSPHVFIGSVDRIVEKCEQLREELGVTSFMLGGVGDLGEVVERLA